MTQFLRGWADWLSPIVYLSSNWISRVGVFLVTTAVVSGILLVPVAMAQGAANAYLGLLAFVVLPILMFAGLALIPLGIAWQRARLRRAGAVPTPSTSHDWVSLFRFVAVATVLNVIIGGYGAYSSVHYMETNAFCGTTCHTIMQPQYTNLAVGNHASIDCVACHVGPGASGFVQAKLGGMRQLVSMATGSYAKPIPGAAEKMSPVAERCESCHSAFRDSADKLRVLRSYYDDEANTPAVTVLMMHTRKIHAAHAVTDCLECHNRPAHTFATAEAAADEALARGAISPMLPFAKKQAVAILSAAYANREDAARRIPEAWAAYYQQSHPGVWTDRRAEVTGSGDAVAAIYANNVFPDMKVGFGTYTSLLGHTANPGCFRCHDGSEAAPTQDCSACHELVADPSVLGIQ